MSDLIEQFERVEERVAVSVAAAQDTASSPESRHAALDEATAATQELRQLKAKIDAAGDPVLQSRAKDLLEDANEAIARTKILVPPKPVGGGADDGRLQSMGDLWSNLPGHPHDRSGFEALEARRCELCKFLRTRPDRSELQKALDWDAERKQLIVQVILAEDQILEDWARRQVPYSDADHDALANAYEGLGQVRDELDKIAESDAEAAILRDNLNFLAETHQALRECIADVDGSKIQKSAKSTNKGVGGATKVLKNMQERGLTNKLGELQKIAQKGSSSGNKLLQNFAKNAKAAEVGSSKVGGQAIRAGGAGKFAEAIGAGGMGLMRMLHEVTERQLIEIENRLSGNAGIALAARNNLDGARAEVRARRIGEAKKQIDAELAANRLPPFEIHKLSDSDTGNYLDKKLYERAGGDSLERVHRDSGRKSSFAPSSAYSGFYLDNGDLWDSATDAALLEWCKKHCNSHSGTKDNRTGFNFTDPKFVLALVAVLLIAIAGVFVIANGDSTSNNASEEPTQQDAVDDQGQPDTEQPSEDLTGPSETAPAEDLTGPSETAPAEDLKENTDEGPEIAPGIYTFAGQVNNVCGGSYEVFLRLTRFLNGEITLDQLLVAGGGAFQTSSGTASGAVAIATMQGPSLFEVWLLVQVLDTFVIYNVYGPTASALPTEGASASDYAGVANESDLAGAVGAGDGSCASEVTDVTVDYSAFPG